MTLAELKLGLNKLLQSSFPVDKYKYYGVDVVEGFQVPCFFTYLKPVLMETNNHNTYEKQMTLYIDYHQEEIDEADLLEKVETIRSIFETNVFIAKQSVNVIGFDFDYIGTDKNIAEITIDLQWFDKIEHKQNQELMASFFYEQKIRMEE